jgi:exosortase/archaeosortase family protein
MNESGGQADERTGGQADRWTGGLVSFFRERRYRHFRDVFWFAVITLAIHYFYRFWANGLHYWPIQEWMNDLQQGMTRWVFVQSTWFDRHLLGLMVQTTGQTLYFENGSWISINSSCAGDKQILQFALLVLIYPGLWKNKLWYVPAGMVIIHLTNILRIVLLSLVSVNKPEWWHFAHNTVLRGMFYVVILVLWIVWVEGINHRRKPKLQNPEF